MTGPWFLYLDESGDLGFSPDKPGRSRHFTICILAISTTTRNRTVASAIKKTLARKLNPKGKRRRMVHELKANATTFEVKEYFFRQLSGVRFGLYALTLNKDRLFPELQRQKDRTYNYLARLILDQLPLENAADAVNLVLDQRKNRKERQEFNAYIQKELTSRLPPKVRLRITHENSVNNHCLQAADLFCWGIFRKYEWEDKSWFDTFRGKVRYDTLYLPPK